MRTALSAILLAATTVAAQADPSQSPSEARGQYLCIAEQSAGLRYDGKAKTWAAQPIFTDDRFILRRLNDDDRKTWAKHSDAGRWGFFLKNCSWGAVEFDDKDGSVTWRWYHDNPNELDGVVIEAGKCSAF